jgi:hypothetical protein
LTAFSLEPAHRKVRDEWGTPRPPTKSATHVASFLLAPQFPTKAKRVRRFVVLALNEKLRTTLVKAKDLVVQIQTRDNRSKTLSEVDAALGVDLEV